MIRNYLVIGLRNLWKRKSVSAVNLLGLATGMAVCLIIVMYLNGETGYDDFVPQGNNVYRVVVDRKYPERTSSYSFIPQSYAAAMQNELPQVKSATRVYNFTNETGLPLRYNDKLYEGNQCLFADSNFFDVFPHKFLAGSMTSALKTHNAIVVTKLLAEKIFGSVTGAIGKQVVVPGNDNELLEVTGVCEDWPRKSHMQFELLRTTAGLAGFTQPNYVNFAAHTYVRLHNGGDPAAIESRFPAIIAKLAVTNIEQAFGTSFQEFQKAGNGYHYYLQPLQNIYLDSHLEGELKPTGSRQAIKIFTIIAIAIFVIACINFINLSTARSVERAKEVGLRKTFGSEKKQLINQFLTESSMLSFTSAIVAIVIALLLLPVFSSITAKQLLVRDLLRPAQVFMLFGMALFAGIAAGLYPALVLSSFKPVQVLKGRFKTGQSGLRLRNALVVFQFSASVILIICTLVVNRQMKFMTSGKLGFDKDLALVIDGAFRLNDQSEAFKNELKNTLNVKDVTLSSGVPGTQNFFGISWQTPESRLPMTGRGILCDEDFASVLGLELVQGRFLSKEFATDSLSVVLNENAVQQLGLANPLNATLVTPEDFLNAPDGTQLRYTVVGVVKNFHYQSMHEPVNPLVFNSNARIGRNATYAIAKLQPGNLPETLAAIEKVWKKFVKDEAIAYHFLDETIEAQYNRELTTMRLFSIFSALAICIACIGLLGLAAYATQQKLHEISVRKVLGASVPGLLGLLSKDFLRLVVIASVLAFPIAWLAMRNWLNDFSFRIALHPWIFAVSGAAALLIAFCTVSVFTVKAALRNPVKSLRAE